MKQTVSGNIKCFDISCSDEDIKRLQQYYIKHCGEHFEILTGGRGHSRTKEIIEDMQNEIERLNNIINELEEYLEDIKMNLRYNDLKWVNDCLIRAEVVRQVLDKLKELKESGNNE